VEFRTGWFVESLATQTLVILVIRTRRVPFFTSRPSIPLMSAAVLAVALGMWATLSPYAVALGFQPLPWRFFIALAALAVAYLALAEATKAVFYRYLSDRRMPTAPKRTRRHRIRRRAVGFIRSDTATVT
jgi:Mg2+-importing ATPase